MLPKFLKSMLWLQLIIFLDATISLFICSQYSFKIRWVGHVARMGEGRGVYRVSVGKPEGKRPLGETQT